MLDASSSTLQSCLPLQPTEFSPADTCAKMGIALVGHDKLVKENRATADQKELVKPISNDRMKTCCTSCIMNSCLPEMYTKAMAMSAFYIP